MAKRGGTCLYKEARLNLEPAFPGSTISITLPAGNTSTFGSRTQPKRSIVTENYADQDEDAFARRHLASDGSMFFRRHHQYPRSFIWRLLDNRKALEIQAADLDHDATHQFEANLTLVLQFASPIRPFCVAFSEPEDRDVLTVFAITTSNDLYTLTIPRDFFVKPTASDQDVADWCKRSSLNQFVLRVPYRLVATSNNELLVSLDDGGILYLKRQHKDDVDWVETVYQQTSWSGSVRGWLPWKGKQTVRFEGAELDSSAAAAVGLSPDSTHIFTACLNHRLRAWNITSGKSGINKDLLGEPDRANDKVAPYLIGPSQATLMAVVNIPGGVDGALYHVVTYSPKQHQFKFWGIRDADDAELGIYDIHSEVDFIPPVDELMNTTVWTLEEFHINPGPAGWRNAQIWVRARSGPSSKVYALKFDLTEDSPKLAHTWKEEWVLVDSGPLTVEGLRQNPTNPGEHHLDVTEAFDPALTERWLDFLFFPGRFTTPTLESALLVFRRGLERQRNVQSSPKGSLKERICNTIGAFAALGQKGGEIDHEEYEEAVSAQWQTFYGLVKDLHKRRGESLSLAFDHEHDRPWLVLSDYLSAIRQCSEPEVILSNGRAIASDEALSGPLHRSLAKPDSLEVSRLLHAAASFRKSLPTSFQHQLQRQVETELLQSRSLSVVDRMELMEANVDISRQVSDEDLSLLVEELGTDVKDLTTETFLRAMETLGQEEEGRTAKKKQVARFGLSALIRVSQEVLKFNHNVLLDLLVLILFMQYEEDVSDDFEASEVFMEIVNQLKDNMILTWMATTAWAHQAPTGGASEALMASLDESFSNSRRFPNTQTVLEGYLGYRSFDSPLPRGLKTELLTYWSRVWLNGIFKERSFDSALEDIMVALICQREFAAASEFSKFLADGNWATYLKGRVHLAFGEHTLASICFQKAAYNLALGLFSVEEADTGDLIPLEQRDAFSEGLPKFYHHALSLFEKAKAYSFAADFAKLGLRTLKVKEDEPLRTELLSRLFTASIQTSRFDEAYSAMTRQTDGSLRHAALQTLVKSMIQQSQVKALFKFPFMGFSEDVDNILASLCHKTLNLTSGPPYHLILYSFRLSRGNFRGAAEILYERLQRLKTTSSKIHDPADESLTQCYLMIINTLSSVGEGEAYILADQRIDETGPPRWGLGNAKKMLKRQIVTLDTLRKEYQAELDRVEAIESGQYPFVDAGDEMDIL